MAPRGAEGDRLILALAGPPRIQRPSDRDAVCYPVV